MYKNSSFNNDRRLFITSAYTIIFRIRPFLSIDRAITFTEKVSNRSSISNLEKYRNFYRVKVIRPPVWKCHRSKERGTRRHLGFFLYGSLLGTHSLCECLTSELPHRENRYMYLAPRHIFGVPDSWLAWNNGRVNSRQ